ncbi:aspartic proteinase nepenthesin-1-like [Silene latifolia]|uniref:aspartic proteinase nepenthesin-1-like n=1 Tax=Silene latifolia TaxID=37657 RepID=UPI003D781DD6
MVPIDSPDLRILPKHFTSKERQHFLRNISLSRAFYANKRNTNLGLNSISSPLSNIQKSYFVTQLTFGNHQPPFSAIVILDTSADLTWVQCANCNPCFNLKNPLPVDESSSYALMGPSDKRCVPKATYNGSCGFESSFGSGYTQGYMGTDNFLFNDSSGYFPNVGFGCGVNNTNFNFDFDSENVIAGIHGLGIGPRSMITQLDVDIKGRFTYCIKRGNGTSTILFGDDAQIKGDDARIVQRIAMKPESRYHLHLVAISVEKERLSIDPSVFTLDDKDFTSGFFIDPSAPFTVLTYTAYIALKSTLLRYFATMYQWEPLASDANIFDLCYSDVPNPSLGQIYPTITFTFVKSPGGRAGEVNLVFDPKHVFGNFGIDKGFCLQMLPTSDSKDGPSILGAFQQFNIQFLFDINNRLLSFVPKDC